MLYTVIAILAICAVLPLAVSIATQHHKTDYILEQAEKATCGICSTQVRTGSSSARGADMLVKIVKKGG